VNVARVQAWRSRHPGYWRKRRRAGTALQDVSMAKSIGSAVEILAAKKNTRRNCGNHRSNPAIW
jgi:hypothetical protein